MSARPCAKRSAINIGAINQAKGADLLALVSQNAGQMVPGGATATVDAIKQAVNFAKLSMEELMSENMNPDGTGSQLDVLA